MFTWLLALQIDHPPFLVSIDILAALGVVFLLVRRPLVRSLVVGLASGLIGVALGYFACWLLGDVWDLFGVDLTPVTRMWVALCFGGILLALTNLWRARWWRRILAMVCIPLFVLTAAAGINVDFGQYATVGDAVGVDPYPAGALAYETGNPTATDASVVQNWRAPGSMPHSGRIFTVHIPGTVSHFVARPAIVYLPPAALVANPPVLPVMIMMSGQPGDPSEVFTAGHVNTLLNAFARAHHGLAPIVVAPDQLGAPSNNPMCVNSPLGNVATYITTDVVNWIHTHLHVSTDRSAWAVGGFSEGATCSIQFAAGYPNLFSATLAVSSELAPTIGARTVAEAFGGSVAAYNAAKPLTILAKNAPYSGDLTYFAVGQNDAKYGPYAAQLADAAKKAGMTTHLLVSPGTAHDWNTVHYALVNALPSIARHLGLS